ncbi:MAG: tyrosine-type recombinase/integrase [Pedococcus sp.]
MSRQVQRAGEGQVDIRPPKYGSERVVPIPDALVTMLAAHVELGHRGAWLHDLRHFYASGLIASGCDVVAVQRALGHAKSTTTLTTYAHLWPTAEDRVRDAAARLAAEVLTAGEGTVRAGDA